MSHAEEKRLADETGGPWPGVVFSLIDGFVWASWPGTLTTIRLGPCETVTPMMRDFLAQSEVGERLLNGTSANR